MPTLLDLLTAPNKERILRTIPGPNSIPKWWPAWPGYWVSWPEFNYNTLSSIYRSHLAANCSEFVHSRYTNFDLEIWNENTLDHFLTRFNFSVVNRALSVASQKHIHLGLGSRCWSERGQMDWGLVSAEHPGSDCPYENLLPGDSKLDSKWNLELYSANYDEWRKAVDQIMGYMVRWGRRYGYIITDQYLYVFRITMEPIGEGIAAHRPSRNQTQQRGAVDVENDPSLADLSQATADLSINTVETEEYDHAGDFQSRTYLPPEYAVVPWSNQGPGKLTVNLALWCLAMMSMEESGIDTGYKSLDSWRKISGGGYVHNTSGVKMSKSKLPKGAVIENDGDGEAEEDNAQEGASAGLPSQHPGGGGGPSISSQDTLYNITEVMSFAGRDRKSQPLYAFKSQAGKEVTTRSVDWRQTEYGWIYEKSGKKYLATRFPRERK